MRQSSRKTSAVWRGAQAVLLDLGAHLEAGRVRRDDERRPGRATPSSGSTEATTTWTSAMPPLVAHAFWPLRTHSSLASSYFARVRSDETSEPALGSETQNDATFGSLGAEALRDPLPHLLGRAGAEDPRDRERRAHDRHADAGVAPEELLVDDRQRQAGRVGPELGDRLEAVQPDLGRLLDDRPGRLLALVPFGRGRAHDALGESVDPVPDVLLVLGELHRERGLALLLVALLEGGLCGGGCGFHDLQDTNEPAVLLVRSCAAERPKLVTGQQERPWDALPPEAYPALVPHLPQVAEAIVEAIPQQIPTTRSRSRRAWPTRCAAASSRRCRSSWPWRRAPAPGATPAGRLRRPRRARGAPGALARGAARRLPRRRARRVAPPGRRRAGGRAVARDARAARGVDLRLRRRAVGRVRRGLRRASRPRGPASSTAAGARCSRR